MENKTVGYILVGAAALIAFISYSFNLALLDIVKSSCSHGPECPMYGAIDFQNYLAIGIITFVLLLAIYLIFFSSAENKKKYDAVLKKLNSDERLVFEKIVKENGSVFQAELVEKTSLSKVKITRILDSLEGKNLVERKRRGMTNIVILKWNWFQLVIYKGFQVSVVYARRITWLL